MLHTYKFSHFLTKLQSIPCCYSHNGVKAMQAWQTFSYGSPENLKLSTTKIPVISRPHDVLVKVQAASINPLDVLMLGGYGDSVIGIMRQIRNCSLYPEHFPLTLGRDFSGTVAAVGSAVRNVRCGDEVWGVVTPESPGSHAEYTITSFSNLYRKPSVLDFIEAASIPYAALTCWSAVCTFGQFERNTAYGKRVLVIGASGGVGTVAVQMLKSWGATVSATCSTDAVDMVQGLGADKVFDYHHPDTLKELQDSEGFDLVLDTVGQKDMDFINSISKRWKKCTYVTIVSPLLKNADNYGIVLGGAKSACEAVSDTVMGLRSGLFFRWAYFMPNRSALKTISEMAEHNEINAVVDEVFAFSDAPEAYQKVLDGHARGKTVLSYAEVPEKYLKKPLKTEVHAKT